MNVREEMIRSNFKFFGGISLGYGILFTFCMYRNLFGAAFLLYAVVTIGVLILFLKKVEVKLKPATGIYFLAVILFGVSTCITGNQMFQFLNWCGIIAVLIIAMLRQLFDDSKWNIGSYMINAVVLFFTTIGCCFLPVAETKKYVFRNDAKQEKSRRGYHIFVGILSACGALVVILPLLISSDMIFERIFGNAIALLQIENLGPNIWTAFSMFLMAFVGFSLIYAFFYASCRVSFPEERPRTFARCNAMAGISFASVVGGIYLLYSGIQIVYLFWGNEGTLPEGITYSAYARSGFWQLVAVALLNIIMVLACRYLFEENKYLKCLLTVICGCTFIMTASAAYRMVLYVEVYHLTVLRVLVFWALIILTLIMIGVVISIYQTKFRLVPYMLMVCICGYLILSFLRPDYLIAKYNVSHMEQIEIHDLYYMTYHLSSDAAPVIADIRIEDINTGAQHEKLASTKGELYRYFYFTAENNKELHLRKANYSRIQAKRAADLYLTEHADDKIYANLEWGY